MSDEKPCCGNCECGEKRQGDPEKELLRSLNPSPFVVGSITQLTQLVDRINALESGSHGYQPLDAADLLKKDNAVLNGSGALQDGRKPGELPQVEKLPFVAKYAVTVTWSDDKRNISCSAFGTTPDEVIRECDDAIAAWLQEKGAMPNKFARDRLQNAKASDS